MGIENGLTRTMAQAKSMSGFAGIELTTGQIENYVSLRKSTNKEIIPVCDQKLLDACLEPDQQRQFRNKFSNITFESMIKY